MSHLPDISPTAIRPDGRYVFAYVGGPTYTGLVGSVHVESGVGRCDGVAIINSHLVLCGQIFDDAPGVRTRWDGTKWGAYLDGAETRTQGPSVPTTHLHTDAQSLPSPGISEKRNRPGRRVTA